VTPEGVICESTVDFMSIYPTLCELADLPTPQHCEGVSIKPLLQDPSAAWSRPALTTHGRLRHAIRSSQFRYIRYDDGSEELYDETSDPYEWQNLAGDPGYADTIAGLKRWLPTNNVARVESRSK
jgi:arylsulfatase A-like enzyme